MATFAMFHHQHLRSKADGSYGHPFGSLAVASEVIGVPMVFLQLFHR
jgi:hypothetical protein